MPYDVNKRGNKYVVIKQENGEVVGEHDTRAEAEAHMKALYVNVPEARSPGTRHSKTTVLDDGYEPVPITEAYVDGKKTRTE